MGSVYGGVLALIAFGTTLTRGLIHRGGVEATLQSAVLCLFLFGAIGFLLGCTAQWTIEDSLRKRLQPKENSNDEESTNSP